MKVAVGGIHTECSTYSPLLQTVDDFKIARGPDLLAQTGLAKGDLGDVALCPLFHARAIPGGSVAETCYAHFRSAFLHELAAALPVDGVLLIMHGAMHVPGVPDPEGDWIGAVRQLVGPNVPIAVSFDLHGNVTQRIMDQIDIFCAYRTAPHIDVPETHLRAARLLADQLRGGPRRCVAWAPVPVLLPGEKTSTEDEPAKSLYTALPAFDLRPGVSDANLMVGYAWADEERATAAAVVTGTTPDETCRAAEEIASAYWDARDRFDFGVPTKSLALCLDDAANSSTRPFVLADSGDNPTGGGVGDRSDVLHEWLNRGLTGAVFAGIADPISVASAWPQTDGSSVDLVIGGALGSSCPKVTATARIRARTGSETLRDRELLVELSGNLVVLTERRRPFHRLGDFQRFGIEPSETRFLIVKSGYLSPELAPIANPARMALTSGAVDQDISKLDNQRRQTPNYPFQGYFDWQPKARLSARALQVRPQNRQQEHK